MTDELQIFKSLISELKKKNSIDIEIEEKIIQSFSKERYLKANEKIDLKAIKFYIFKPSGRIIWTVMGEKNNYLVYPNKYCSCIDFYLHWIIKRKTFFCKHLLAQGIVENLGSYDPIEYQIEVEDKDFDKIFKRIKE